MEVRVDPSVREVIDHFHDRGETIATGNEPRQRPLRNRSHVDAKSTASVHGVTPQVTVHPQHALSEPQTVFDSSHESASGERAQGDGMSRPRCVGCFFQGADQPVGSAPLLKQEGKETETPAASEGSVNGWRAGPHEQVRRPSVVDLLTVHARVVELGPTPHQEGQGPMMEQVQKVSTDRGFRLFLRHRFRDALAER